MMDVLLSIPKEIIRAKQGTHIYAMYLWITSVELISRIAPRLQYAVPPIEMLKHKRDNSLWDPPFEDGAEVALQGMFERTRKVIAGEPSNIPNLKNMTKSELKLEYDKEILVKVPGEPRQPYTLHETI